MSDNYSLLDELVGFARDDLVVTLEALARTGAPFTYATAVERLPERTQALLRDPAQAKFAGGIMKRLKKAKVITPTGQFERATHKDSRGHVVCLWKGVK